MPDCRRLPALFPWIVLLLCALVVSHGRLRAQSFAPAAAPATTSGESWRFDNLSRIGGHPVALLGHPQLIDTPWGRAVQFDGKADGLFLDAFPLAGATAYTWEVVFRPDADGAEEQRFFHMQEQNPVTGQDTTNRLLTEIRLHGNQWCLDSHGTSMPSRATILVCDAAHLHPAGQWYRVATVYDGHTLRNYVDGQLQGEAEFALAPMLGGRTSVGIRINSAYPFKGAVLAARMTPRALAPAEFLPWPPPTGK